MNSASPRPRLEYASEDAHNDDMQVQVDIPDDITQALSGTTRDISRSFLEATAIEGYRSRRLSEYQVQRMLGFDHRLQVHAFLKENDTPMNYSAEDLDHDMETLKELRQSASAGR